MYTYGVYIYIYVMYIYTHAPTLCTTFKPTFRLSKWDPIHGQRVDPLKTMENLKIQ